MSGGASASASGSEKTGAPSRFKWFAARPACRKSSCVKSTVSLMKNAAPCSQNCEIILSDITAKTYHKARRTRVAALLTAGARASQIGGICGRATDA